MAFKLNFGLLQEPPDMMRYVRIYTKTEKPAEIIVKCSQTLYPATPGALSYLSYPVFFCRINHRFEPFSMIHLIKRWVFRWLPDHKKLSCLLNEGTLLGMRSKNGRTAYLYMFHNWCAEVIFQQDTPHSEVEKILIFSNVAQFNQYLEKELRGNF